MPYLYDFGNAHMTPVEVRVDPSGWKGPLVVEYVVAQAHVYDTCVSVIWRVKGTEHCFTIFEQKLNQLCNGNYKRHFEEVLQNFRLDYINWFEDPSYNGCEWREDYRRQFGELILPKGYNSEKSNG